MSRLKHTTIMLIAIITLGAASLTLVGCGDDGGASIACSTATLDPLKLAADHCVEHRVALSQEVVALALRDGQLFTALNKKDSRDFRVEAATIGKDGALLAPKTKLSFTAAGSEKIFAANYLTISPAGRVAAGYNTADFANPAGFVYVEGRKDAVVAPGNYDVSFFDEQTLLINGKGSGELKGQAVYAVQDGKKPTRLISELGSASGPLLVGQTLVFAGGFFADKPAGMSGKTKIYAFTRDEISAAIAAGKALTPQKDGDEVYVGQVADSVAWGDDLVIAHFDANFAFDGVTRRIVSADGDKLTAGAPTTLIEKGQAGMVKALCADGPRLAMILEDAAKAPQLVVLGKK